MGRYLILLVVFILFFENPCNGFSLPGDIKNLPSKVKDYFNPPPSMPKQIVPSPKIDSKEPLESPLSPEMIVYQNMLKEFEEIKRLLQQPVDCCDILLSGKKTSGRYIIYPYTNAIPSRSDPVETYCDMDTDDGGWTVFLKREKQSTQLNFTKGWKDYKEGFGTPKAEYWLGNDALHFLTFNRNNSMRVDVKDTRGREMWGKWNDFQVDSEKLKYKLRISDYDTASTVAENLNYLNGTHFTTVDQDNDRTEGYKNCAVLYKGGWWYKNCHFLHPTGVYGEESPSGIQLYSKDAPTSRKYADWLQMKIRPKICRRAVASPVTTVPPSNFG